MKYKTDKGDFNKRKHKTNLTKGAFGTCHNRKVEAVKRKIKKVVKKKERPITSDDINKAKEIYG